MMKAWLSTINDVDIIYKAYELFNDQNFKETQLFKIAEGAGLVFSWVQNLFKAISGYFLFGELENKDHINIDLLPEL